MSPELTSVKGIGQKTADKLRRRLRGSRATTNVGGSVSVSEAASNPAVTKTVLNAKQQRGLSDAAVGFRPERSARKQQSSGSSSSSDSSNVGDFRVLTDDRKKASDFHQSRSQEAQRIDENRRAPIETDFQEWADDPDDLDFPGVDTPASRSPRAKDKDEPFVEFGDDLIRDVFGSDS